MNTILYPVLLHHVRRWVSMARKSRKNPTPEVAPAIERRTAIYVRLSREDVQKKGDSLENQKNICLQHLLSLPELGTSIVYEDNGFSGQNTDRPEFQKLLSDVENGLIESLIVKDLSRLGRNTIETGYLLDKLFPLHDVRFIAVTDNYDSSIDQGSIMIPIKNMLNEAYAIDIGKKVSVAKQKSIQAGYYIGSVTPYGFLRDETNRHKLVVDEVTAPVVREIFQLVADGNSVASVVRILNERKELSPSDYRNQRKGTKIDPDTQCNWTRFITTRILKSQHYIGNMEQGKSTSKNRVSVKNEPDKFTLVKGTHEAIVSDELFQRVQEQLEKSSGASTKPKLNLPNLFKSKIFCGGCGRHMDCNLISRKKDSRLKYVCNTPQTLGASFCEYESVFKIRETVLLEVLGTALDKQAEVLLGKNLILLEKEVELDKITSKSEKQLKELDKLIKKNQKYLKSLYENLVTNTITPDEYKTLKSEYESVVEKSKLEYWEIKEKKDSLSKEIKQLNTLTDNLKKTDFIITKKVVDEMIDKITVYKGNKLEIQFSFSFPMIDEVIENGE